MSGLLIAVLLLSALTGTLVVLSRDPHRQIFTLCANGVVLTVLFELLQAPDVALSELVIGAAVTPLLFVAALTSIALDRERTRRRSAPDREASGDPDAGHAGARARGQS
jgi:uncharacterized MnhB-related membrane protein